MPKRKRTNSDEDDGDRILRRRKTATLDELTRSKKLLHRALKTAKGFERQKLGKRLKSATSKSESEEIKRINNEIEALKTVDLDKVTTAQLCRSLLKIKEFRDSEILPEEVRGDLPKPEGSDEEVKALHNVTSGMCNAKVVREEVTGVIQRMYAAMGIPVPAKEGKGKGMKKEVDDSAKAGGRGEIGKKVKVEVLEDKRVAKPPEDEDDSDEKSWEGLDGSNKENEGQEELHDEGEPLDEEELQQYDALLGASSDEESFHEEDWLPKEKPEQTRFSISPSPSLSPSILGSISPSPEPELEPELQSESDSEPEPEPRPKKTSKPKVQSGKGGNSTFLPSLMGGYWSGSESEASDLENAPPAKKNRPGQMARRAIWEKKYGEKANHIKTGQGLVASRGKDDGWDAKRGAKDSSSGRGRGREPNRDKPKVMNRKDRRSLMGGTGENATPIAPRNEPPKKMRDDVGVLHPSWQAAKIAKEMKKAVAFQGKKVTFD
ncbi:uncharacterized protein PAC_02122 [Phialocephala subalpina]|uniref:Bud22 domain-containing protein n=1 Tax=Phialocephala subalpina TaxID=576137 RepID=A0A1L7WHJ8_9HELO|nr:uncharacterized protein PAC_02122 [Phialocephala subalpina]